MNRLNWPINGVATARKPDASRNIVNASMQESNAPIYATVRGVITVGRMLQRSDQLPLI